MIINCPSCSSSFQVTVAAVDHTGKKYTADSPITPAAMRAVFEFMHEMGPGRYASSILSEAYRHGSTGVHQDDWPPLSDQALFLAMSRNGAERWRTASTRGWVIPETQRPKPAPVARSVQEALDAEDYRRTVERHIGGGRPRAEAGESDDEFQARIAAGLPPF